jgi:CheY-like chemotaxis protein
MPTLTLTESSFTKPLSKTEQGELSEDVSNTMALVIESNPGMRSVLAAQLRDYGVKRVVLCARIADAREHLENRKFDFVLCEQYFREANESGQEFLDDLRRNQLLPFSTVFLMITGEATYSKVAEAAESALDGYLLKPHKASQLYERLQSARVRKVALQDIFTALEADDYKRAASLCLARFKSKAPYWLYAARIGAELLLRVERPEEAKMMYEAVIAAKAVPWAKLGVARSMLDSGKTTAAVTTLANMIAQDPSYVDAYDVMGRAQFELGKIDEALATYKQASQLTPGSIGRLQSVGIMSFYAGDIAGAEAALRRTCIMGIESKLFDFQSLALLAFVQFDRKDVKGVQRCVNDFDRAREKFPDSERIRRLSGVAETLLAMQQGKTAAALASVRDLIKGMRNPDFDFESASNLVTLMSLMAKRSIQLDEVEEAIDSLGLRFCSNKSMSELLAGAANAFPQYAQSIRGSSAKLVKYAEYAMTLSMNGDPRAATKELIAKAHETLNVKLIDSAEMVIKRYSEKMDDISDLQASIQSWRSQYAASAAPVSAEGAHRKAGAMSLRVGGTAKKNPLAVAT